MYQKSMSALNAVWPVAWAKISYYRCYGQNCNLKEPKTFSEKLLWLWLNNYRNNPLISQLSDKYEVRKFIADKGLERILNELYFVTDDAETIHLKDLPDKFALKLSQGWNTNLICDDKAKLTEEELRNVLAKWSRGQFFYDLSAAKIGGFKRKQLPKHYICEKYLEDRNHHIPDDIKIYCFNGVPTAILLIADRFGEKKGCFVDTDWNFMAPCNSKYQTFEKLPSKPASLSKMIEVAKVLSAPFSFVRVDLYEVDDKPIFGEMTFFPNGCTGTQETVVDGKTMGELLYINIDTKHQW